MKPSFFDFKTPISVVIGSQQINYSTNISTTDNNIVIDIDSNTDRNTDSKTPNKSDSITDRNTNTTTAERKTKRSTEHKPLAILASVDLRTTPACTDQALNLIPPDKPSATSTITSEQETNKSDKLISISTKPEKSTTTGGVVVVVDEDAAFKKSEEARKPSVDVFKSIFESSDEEDASMEQHGVGDKNQQDSSILSPTSITITTPTTTKLSITKPSTATLSTATNNTATASTATNNTAIVIGDDDDESEDTKVHSSSSKVHLLTEHFANNYVWVPKKEQWVQKSRKKSKHKKHKVSSIYLFI